MSRPSRKEVEHKQKVLLRRAIKDFDRTWEETVQPRLNELDQQLVESLKEVFTNPDVPLDPGKLTIVEVALVNGIQVVQDTAIDLNCQNEH